MWHEARKHEKKIRGIMVDYKKRAERRREFYEKIRRDPASFLQIHGHQLKIHIDATISQAAESSLMPWQGDNNNLIDRFDVRAHLDYIPTANDIQSSNVNSSNSNDVPLGLERQINYERYRNLVQNDFLGITEAKCLHQIFLEERFGGNQQNQQEQQLKMMNKKKLAEKKAMIGYNYEEEDSESMTVKPSKGNDSSDGSDESSDEDIDFDTSVNVDQLTSEQGHRINSIAHKFGMKNDDFLKFLDEDKVEAEKIRLAKELENEKSMFSGRKSRRERKALKEQRLLILRTTNSDENETNFKHKNDEEKQSQSSSDSECSVDETKVEFITSFGGSSEDESKKDAMKKKDKQKDFAVKKKLKAKFSSQEKTEEIPLIYGPSLPGQDLHSTHQQSSSFNKFRSSNYKRSYRYNSSRSRSRSRSNSLEKRRYRRYRSRSRSRSRSLEKDFKSSKYGKSVTPKRRSRSPSSGRKHSRNYRRSRSSSKSKRTRRSRSKSWDRHRRRSRSRSRSRRRNRSRSKSKSRSRSRRRSWSKTKSRNIRSRSKSRERNKIDQSKFKERDSKTGNRSESKNKPQVHSHKDKSTKESINENPNNSSSNKLLSPPPIKRYYRQDLEKDSNSDDNDDDNHNKSDEKEKIPAEAQEYK